MTPTDDGYGLGFGEFENLLAALTRTSARWLAEALGLSVRRTAGRWVFADAEGAGVPAHAMWERSQAARATRREVYGIWMAIFR